MTHREIQVEVDGKKYNLCLHIHPHGLSRKSFCTCRYKWLRKKINQGAIDLTVFPEENSDDIVRGTVGKIDKGMVKALIKGQPKYKQGIEIEYYANHYFFEDLGKIFSLDCHHTGYSTTGKIAYLLHKLRGINFEDIKSEEYVSGHSGRSDLSTKDGKIIVEIGTITRFSKVLSSERKNIDEVWIESPHAHKIFCFSVEEDLNHTSNFIAPMMEEICEENKAGEIRKEIITKEVCPIWDMTCKNNIYSKPYCDSFFHKIQPRRECLLEHCKHYYDRDVPISSDRDCRYSGEVFFKKYPCYTEDCPHYEKEGLFK